MALNEKNSMKNNIKPRVILLLQYYDPEPAYKGKLFAEAIANAGFDVEVVTGFPNYPGGKVYDGFRVRPIHKSREGVIGITRLALYPSHSKSKVGRALNYISFMLSAFLYLTFFTRRPDLVYAYHPPLTVGLAAAAASIFRRNPVIVDIHDLWPDSLPATGMIKNTKVLKAIGIACNWMYNRAQHIVLHSHGFREELIRRGIQEEKMTTVIGWANEKTDPNTKLATPQAMKDIIGLKIVYAGNMGPAQALESVLDAAQILQSTGHGSTATFCMLGSGLALDALKQKAHDLALSNVVFMPRVTQTEVEAYLESADVLLMHLRDTPLFALNMPSKAQVYMLAAKPILAGVQGEVAKLLRDADAGISVPSENPIAMADAVISFVGMSEQDRKKLGDNGYTYYWNELCMEKGIAKLVTVFHDVCGA